MVPGAGIEPALCFQNRFLRPITPSEYPLLDALRLRDFT